ncbi:MAG: hypothetical protein JXN64_13690 [Spirochaetes bacterium]|nr:hypothetical protein [Spirochaetota bacterium]
MINYNNHKWNVISTLHFNIYYPDEMTDLGFYAAKAAEESYVYLANYFKHEIGIVIPIVISAMLSDESRRILDRIDLSFAGSYRLFHIELTRQMVHVFLYDILYESNPPGWPVLSHNGFSDIPASITEGIATYLSGGYDEDAAAGFHRIINTGKSGMQLDIKSILNFRGRESAITGQSFFNFLEKSFGQDVISELIFNIRDNDNVYDAIAISTGMAVDELNTRWIDFSREITGSLTENKIPSPDNADLLKKKKGDFRINYNSRRNTIGIYNNSGKAIKEIQLPFINVKEPDISTDGKYFVFIGQSFNSSDVYICNVQDLSLVRVTNDRFEKRSPNVSADNNYIVYLSNENGQNDIESNIFRLNRFDLRTNTKRVLADNRNELLSERYKRIKYPDSYFEVKDFILSDYSDDLEFDFSTHAGGIAWDRNFTGFLNIQAQDFLRMHKFEFDAEYYRYKINDKDNDLNFNFDYEFSKYYVGLGIGAFYKEGPLESGFSSAYMEDTCNAIIFYANNINSKHKCMNSYIIFPFTSEFFFELKYFSSIYENVNSISAENNYRKNMYSKQLSLSFNYDNLIYDKVWPINGAKAALAFSENFDMSERELSLSVLSFNFLKIFQYNKIFVFSVKGSAGKIFGRDEKYFNYYIGGFNSIRGHDFFGYRGRNAFALNTEIRFILFEKVNFRWPVTIKFNDICLALFADFGSAWDADYNLRNSDSGRFDDLKSGAGCGLRFLLQDHIVFKLDAVWPYSYESFGEREIVSGFEFRY